MTQINSTRASAEEYNNARRNEKKGFIKKRQNEIEKREKF
jgi:hypothetical protein